MSVKCPGCGFIYMGHTNYFGKVCTRCYSLIPADKELSIVKNNRLKYEALRQQAIDLVREKKEGNRSKCQ